MKLIRIVQMKFKEGKAEEFMKIFSMRYDHIMSFKGCEQLEIIKDEEDPNALSTKSVWSSIDALDAYRNSDFFNVLWDEIKPFFAEPPEAHSMIE